MNYHELEKTTVVRLREMLKEKDPDLKGISGMKKDQLVDLLADKLGVEKPHKVAVGIDKTSLKKKIREVKKVRDQAIAAKDREKMRQTREELHKLRRKLRRAVKVVA